MSGLNENIQDKLIGPKYLIDEELHELAIKVATKLKRKASILIHDSPKLLHLHPIFKSLKPNSSAPSSTCNTQKPCFQCGKIGQFANSCLEHKVMTTVDKDKAEGEPSFEDEPTYELDHYHIRGDTMGKFLILHSIIDVRTYIF